MREKNRRKPTALKNRCGWPRSTSTPGGKLLREVGLFDVYEGKNLPAGKKSYAVRFILQDPNRTLDDKVIDKRMGEIQKALEEEFGAELR
ncbi:MAG: hypothetical protein LC670_01980 [Flavobacteriales bacterium]|nr:hypothetical protein [Flavobacteriales bacterium]